jgi:hypothetical protein
MEVTEAQPIYDKMIKIPCKMEDAWCLAEIGGQKVKVLIRHVGRGRFKFWRTLTAASMPEGFWTRLIFCTATSPLN